MSVNRLASFCWLANGDFAVKSNDEVNFQLVGISKSDEDLWLYWRDMISINVARVSGLVLVRVLAFTPDDALALARATAVSAEKMIDSVAGRIFWRVWEPMVRHRNFKAGILLREPFEELSERLLILKWASLSSANSTAAILGQTIHLCAKNFCNVNLGDLTTLQDLLSRPSDDLRAVLYNPIVYQLAAPNAFDPPDTAGGPGSRAASGGQLG